MGYRCEDKILGEIIKNIWIFYFWKNFDWVKIFKKVKGNNEELNNGKYEGIYI